jgi:ATP-dependent 26S proteasome regulatory subunit
MDTVGKVEGDEVKVPCNQDFIIEFDSSARGRKPIILIVSSEEERVETNIEEVVRHQVAAGRIEKKVMYWKFTNSHEPKAASKMSMESPVEALNFVINNKGTPTFFIMRDTNQFFTNGEFQRRLRDVYDQLKRSNSTLVLICPTKPEIPKGLDKEITNIDFPLPDKVELRVIFDQLLDGFSKNPKVKITLTDEDKRQAIKWLVGLTASEVEETIKTIVARTATLDKDLISLIKKEIKKLYKDTGFLEFIIPEDLPTNIGGLDVLKKFLEEKKATIISRDNPDFDDGGEEVDLPTGIAIGGLPGSGKSLCAKTVPNIFECELWRFVPSNLMSGVVGSTEENMREALKMLSSPRDKVIWVDEIEKVFGDVGDSSKSDGGVLMRVFGEFITWLNEKNQDPKLKKILLFVVATFNSFRRIPPEFFRKGRFNELFAAMLPTKKERKEIFSIMFGKHFKPNSPWLDKKLDTDLLVSKTKGFTGAEIEELIKAAKSRVRKMKADGNSGAKVTNGIIINLSMETKPLSEIDKEAFKEMIEFFEGRFVNASSPDPTDIPAGEAVEA